MAVGDTRLCCALFPESKFFASVEQKRASQAVSLEQLPEAVLQRVTSEGPGPTHLHGRSARYSCGPNFWVDGCPPRSPANIARRLASNGRAFSSKAHLTTVVTAAGLSFKFQYFKSFAWHSAGGFGAWW